MKNVKLTLVITFIFSSFSLTKSCNNNDVAGISQQDELSLIIEKISKNNVLEMSSTKSGRFRIQKKMDLKKVSLQEWNLVIYYMKDQV